MNNTKKEGGAREKKGGAARVVEVKKWKNGRTFTGSSVRHKGVLRAPFRPKIMHKA